MNDFDLICAYSRDPMSSRQLFDGTVDVERVAYIKLHEREYSGTSDLLRHEPTVLRELHDAREVAEALLEASCHPDRWVAAYINEDDGPLWVVLLLAAGE